MMLLNLLNLLSRASGYGGVLEGGGGIGFVCLGFFCILLFRVFFPK